LIILITLGRLINNKIQDNKRDIFNIISILLTIKSTIHCMISFISFNVLLSLLLSLIEYTNSLSSILSKGLLLDSIISIDELFLDILDNSDSLGDIKEIAPIIPPFLVPLRNRLHRIKIIKQHPRSVNKEFRTQLQHDVYSLLGSCIFLLHLLTKKEYL